MHDDPVHFTDQLRDLVHDLKAQTQIGLREEGTGLSHMEARALTFFAGHPGACQADLVQAAHRDKAQVTRTVRELTERGLLERAEVEGDRRSYGLRLTETGRQLQLQVKAQRRKLAETMLHGLNEEQKRTLAALLEHLRANVAQK
jgi:DNA-binding MarR family transcriptional regulator